MPTLSTELVVTLAVLALEVLLVVLCRVKLKQPVNPGRPRLMPYNAILMIAMLGILFTLAHTVSLVTGHQLMPKMGKGQGGGMGGGGPNY